MAHFRQSNVADDRHEHGKDGDEGRGRGGVTSLVEEYERERTAGLEHLGEVAQAQHERSRSFTTMHTASILGPGLIFQNLHLPEEAAIASAFIENNSTVATLHVYEGSSGSGRLIGIVRPSSTKRMALSDYLSSLSIVADQADPAPSALVIAVVTSHRWSPTNGTAP